jgi:hypothetical protein
MRYYPTPQRVWESIYKMVDGSTTVTIKTRQGSEYCFPDVPRATLATMINQRGWDASGSVLIVNLSGACLSVPLRIVDTLSYDGAVKWTGSPA